MARARRPGPLAKDASKRGRAAQRQRFLAEKRGDLDPAQLQQALAVRRRQQQAAAAKPRARAAGARAAPDAAQQLQWLPIGPTVVLAGQAGGRPRVAGRVRDVQVSSNGLRAYAATANGGVWYSDDAGESWRPLGGWTTTGDPPPIDRPSSVLACGCLLVRFDPANNAAADEVYVGTGELVPVARGRPFPKNSGVGVLHATGPATSTIFAAPWTVEGGNLANSRNLPPRRRPGRCDDARRRDVGGPLDAHRWPARGVEPGRGRSVRGRPRRAADLHRRALGRRRRRDTDAALGRGARRRRRCVGGVGERERSRRPVQPDCAADARRQSGAHAAEPTEPRAGTVRRTRDVRARRSEPGLALRQPEPGRRRAHPAESARRPGLLQPGDRRAPDATRAPAARRRDRERRRPMERVALPRERHRACGGALAVRLHRARCRRRSDDRRFVRRQRRPRRRPRGALRHRRRAHRSLGRLRRGRVPVAARQRRQPAGQEQLHRAQQRHGDARMRLRRDPSRGRRPRRRRGAGQRHARARRHEPVGPAVRRRRRRRRRLRPRRARPLHRPGDERDLPRLRRVVQRSRRSARPQRPRRRTTRTRTPSSIPASTPCSSPRSHLPGRRAASPGAAGASG